VPAGAHFHLRPCQANEEPALAWIFPEPLARRERQFGPAVLAIVEGCTDADVDPKPPWRPRKEAYLAHLAHAPAAVRLVSCADKLHNARAIVADLRVMGPALFERFTGKREGTLWYYRALAAEFARGGPEHLAAELGLTVETMEALPGA